MSSFSITARKEAAVLVADGSSVQMALLWVKVLDSLADCSLAFPELDGRPVQHLERKMAAAAKAIGHTLPTSTDFRKALEFRNKRLTGPIREAVSRALCHSMGTASQYYQAPTASDAYNAYSVVQDIVGGARAASPTEEDMDVEGKREGGYTEDSNGDDETAVCPERRHTADKGKRKPVEEEREGAYIQGSSGGYQTAVGGHSPGRRHTADKGKRKPVGEREYIQGSSGGGHSRHTADKGKRKPVGEGEYIQGSCGGDHTAVVGHSRHTADKGKRKPVGEREYMQGSSGGGHSLERRHTADKGKRKPVGGEESTQDSIGGDQGGHSSERRHTAGKEKKQRVEEKRCSSGGEPTPVSGGHSPEGRHTVDKGKRKKEQKRATPLKTDEVDDEAAHEWRPSPKKKKRYSKGQTELLEKYFSRHIADRSFPTAMECRDFMQLYKSQFEGRTVKDIYDKCRNIAGR